MVRGQDGRARLARSAAPSKDAPMAKEGLFAWVCAGLVLTAGQLVGNAVAAEEPANVTTALSVQTALQQGRDQLLHGNPRGAVYVLESQLARINGNREYLMTLRDAYRGYIKELRPANEEEPAQRYLQRLLIRDPGAGGDPAVTRAANSTAPTPTPKTTVKTPPTPTSKAPTTARG